ncbi:UvrD-helicase domain-containing protein [Dyadobacter sp. 3J3]|uniref:UvrD-helicase domain-containing protein n=1 Tax=Dyadobacter sp. 3J3 TaxID=2606600 RepID=UPI00190F5CC0|nr:ATP-dependent helicase [Dyadobacter sp. 3J3]
MSMILSKLSSEQRTAVTQDGHVLLTACPGSGKTRVIIHKLAYEIERIDHLRRKRVAAVTFTIRASEEIFRRLNSMGINSKKVWSGTLHSFCLEWIVKPYAGYLPELRNGFSIADESYCLDLLSSLKTKYNLKEIDSINLRFGRDGNFIENKAQEKKVLSEYHEILRKSKQIDFELLLFYAYKILSSFPRIQKTLSDIFRLICVDEFQDTQDLLYAIISQIVKVGKGNTALFLVGDTDQAIYASLGGVAKTIEEIRFEIGNQHITPLTLTGNYRTCQRIIDFYRHFQTQPIDIIAVGKNAKLEGSITFNNSINERDLVTEIARLIELSIEKGISESEICLLVPQWWLVTKISRQLRIKLPDINFDASGLSPMSKNRDNIWYKLSRLLLTTPSPKLYTLRRRWANELINDFVTESKGEFDENYRNIRNLLKLINSIRSAETEGIDYLHDCFSKFLDVVDLDYVTFPSLIESHDQFFESIRRRLTDTEFNIPSDIESFKSFYREMTGVVINTCVGIKGEEFETVIAYGLLRGYVPHWNEIFAGNESDASKKLLYVVCSRAKTNLHLISEIGRKTQKGKPLVTNTELQLVNFDYDEI